MGHVHGCRSKKLVDLCELENFINFLSRNVLPGQSIASEETKRERRKELKETTGARNVALKRRAGSKEMKGRVVCGETAVVRAFKG